MVNPILLSIHLSWVSSCALARYATVLPAVTSLYWFSRGSSRGENRLPIKRKYCRDYRFSEGSVPPYFLALIYYWHDNMSRKCIYLSQNIAAIVDADTLMYCWMKLGESKNSIRTLLQDERVE